MKSIAESTVEEAVLEWAGDMDYAVLNGPDIAPGEPAAERASYADVLLVDRMKAALAKLNQKIPAEALDDASRKLTHTETANLFENNRRFHRMLVDGIDVEYHADVETVPATLASRPEGFGPALRPARHAAGAEGGQRPGVPRGRDQTLL